MIGQNIRQRLLKRIEYELARVECTLPPNAREQIVWALERIDQAVTPEQCDALSAELEELLHGTSALMHGPPAAPADWLGEAECA